ncbi:MAG TPA: endonuclease/exonuclease/phosphatase family protein [Woeseiaceae bacterium]|nr:endonuclease/exonuclease/phosphatase family protein [Woeseiaceae bacterium]
MIPDRRNARLAARLAAVLAVVAAVVAGACASAPTDTDADIRVRLMAFNIRTASAEDGADAWPQRAALVVATIRDADPDVIGLQEAEPEQVAYLAANLTDYAYLGRSREADPGAGEAVPLFYKAAHWQPDAAESGTFWLSDTPDVPASRTWGNSFPRIATWARLVHRDSGTAIYVYNLHLDHESEPARRQSAELVAGHAGGRQHADPVVVLGDFNALPDSAVVQTLTAAPLELRDSLLAAGGDGAAGTFHAFKGIAGERRIDYILVSPELRVLDADILRDHESGPFGDRYPSDHFPVTATVALGP